MEVAPPPFALKVIAKPIKKKKAIKRTKVKMSLKITTPRF